MKNAHHLRRLLALLCLSICLVALCACASAVERVNPSAKVSLTLDVACEGQQLSGVTFSLYRVASMNADTSFTLAAPFEASALKPEDIHSGEEMDEAAAKLEKYIKDNAIKADMTASTDEAGKATFGSMKPGLFLALGKTMNAGGFTYTISPALVMIPQLDAETGEWDYAPVAKPKVESQLNIVDLRVIKHWEREFGTLSHRPENILIDLYCDDKCVGTVKLNRKNGWTATFKNLDMSHDWSVEERRVPNWYDVSYGEIEIDENGKAVVIVKNTLRHSPKRIPQTGLPWWPVPLLVGAGVLLIVAGRLIRRKGSQRHE